jgi:recombinational DNA repair ATPase RecF
VIQIDSITMRDVRGIRDLTLNFDQKSFVISGPNGSGKSGVVDAIEFCLTGEISRLSGKGTAGITLQRHGPHVGRRDDPAAAEVTVRLNLLKLGKSATITRNMKRPRELRIVPDEPYIRAALVEVASHPEVVLSRREIIKYVLAEAGERSREVQALLRLDRISQVRGALGTVHNKLKSASDQALEGTANALGAMKRHLDIETTSPENIVAAVNARRTALALPPIDSLTEHTALDAGVETGARASSFNKDSAARDVDALRKSLDTSPEVGLDEVGSLLDDIAAIEADPSLLQLVQRESFIQTGLEYLETQFCPLCDSEWADVDSLRVHLEEKLALSATAGESRKRMLNNAGELVKAVRSSQVLLKPVIALAKSDSKDDVATLLTEWSEGLGAFADELATIEGVLRLKDRLAAGWADVPRGLGDALDSLSVILNAKPDQSATVNAQTFLTRAQDRYSEYRNARQAERTAKTAQAAAKAAYDTYSAVSEESLSAMYGAVQDDFGDYYRTLNSGDEAGFKARLEQGAGKLDLSVDFYGLGMFPPGAYHSEGHQDGMGVCLYLALMKRLFGDEFSFAVLDDVVMSIDSGHRKQFCRLLREVFPDTQFIITTHDAIWARQMRSEGLIGSGASIEFQGWSVQTGPIFEPVSEVWERIEADLARNDVSAAAGRLRRHLEYTCTELADLLAAQIPFRGDASYELGDLFSAVVGRQRDLLKLAAAAANSWNDGVAKAKVDAMKEQRRAALATYGDEQWVVNKAIHFNEWAEFSKADFAPVVEAVKALLEQFQCSNPDCGSWMYPSPKNDPESLRCRCGSVVVNLKKK